MKNLKRIVMVSGAACVIAIPTVVLAQDNPAEPPTTRPAQIEPASSQPVPGEPSAEAPVTRPVESSAPATPSTPTPPPLPPEFQLDKLPETERVIYRILAERIVTMTRAAQLGGAMKPEGFRYSAAVLKIANRINPDEPRYLRLLIEAQINLGEVDAAISTMQNYRKLLREKYRMVDTVAEIKLMQLFVGRMQTADERIAYLTQIMNASGVNNEVRSFAGVQLARQHIDRSDLVLARESVTKAIELNPLNPDAQRLRLLLADIDDNRIERVAACVGIIRCNPADVSIMLLLAAELADAGAFDLSNQWYNNAFEAGLRIGIPKAADDVARHASALFLADQLNNADGIVEQLLQADSVNADAAFLKLLLARRSADKVRIEAAKKQGGEILRSRLNYLSQMLSMPPTTNPSERPNIVPKPELPDLAGDLKKLPDASEEVREAYTLTLIDLAWYEIYFNQQPQEAGRYMELLRALIAEDSPSLVRLEGWSLLMAGKKDEARVKLSAVADRDPLSQMGMLSLAEEDEASQADANAKAKDLVLKSGAGLVGAMLMDQLRSRVGSAVTAPDAGAIRDLVATIPSDWLLILTKPNLFYELRADTRKIEFEYGEPMVATVTLRNLSKYDIAMGVDGTIRPDIWIDAQLRVLQQQNLAGVAFDRMEQGTVLKAERGFQLTQDLRVDIGTLGQTLASNPLISVPMYLSVVTNPVSIRDGIIPGPAGFREQFRRPVERKGINPQDRGKIQALYNLVSAGKPEEKIRAIDILSTLAQGLKQQDVPEEFKKMGVDMARAIETATNDSSPTIRAWAALSLASFDTDAVKLDRIAGSLKREDWWMRLWAILLCQSQSSQKAQELLAWTIESDPDPLLREFAKCVVDLMKVVPAATMPATMPAVVPGTQPTGESTIVPSVPGNK